MSKRKSLKTKSSVLRTLRIVASAFLQFYVRLSLSLYVRGVRIPGVKNIKNKQTPELRAAIERRILIREIRGQRFAFRKGPLWLRRFGDKFIQFVQRNRFWFSILVKLSIGLVLVVLPTVFFFLLRGTLPVPERVPVRSPQVRLNAQTNYRTDWLYTESPFEKGVTSQSGVANIFSNVTNRGINVTPVLEPGAPLGLFHIGIGAYPRRVELLRGFFASEGAPLTIVRQRPPQIDIAGTNHLHIKYYLVPERSRQSWCRIQIRDDSNKLLLSSEQRTTRWTDENSGLKHQFQARFTPDLEPAWVGEVHELTLDTDVPPEQLHVQIGVLGDSPLSSDSAVTLKTLEQNDVSYTEHDVSDQRCVFAIGDLSFESAHVKSLARRGVILALVDTLRYDTTRDAELMPNLNQFAKSDALTFNEHRAQGNMTVLSVSSMMYSRYPREIGTVAFVYAFPESLRRSFYAKNLTSLPSIARSLGYRTAAIGNVSLFSEALEGGIDFGFHDALVLENPQYETRNVTEEALNWLERNGNVPFFLYLHYHTMHGPYRPPPAFLNVLDFLRAPFGLNGQQELYRGLARFWDNDFKILLDKLRALGLYDDVDLMVTADHGAQLDAQPYGYLNGINSSVAGATADKGHLLTDEEVHVPFYLKIAGKNLGGEHVNAVSAHIDVLPSLVTLLSGKNYTGEARGINWLDNTNSINASSIENRLSPRSSLLIDGHHYAGVFAFGTQFDRPLKYIRQLDPEKVSLYESNLPGAREESWFEPEIFTAIDFAHHRETWLPKIGAEQLLKLRKLYSQSSASPRLLKLRFFYDGETSFSVSAHVPLNVQQVPPALNATTNVFGLNQKLQVKGTVHNGDEVTIEWNNGPIEQIRFDDKKAALISCPSAVRFSEEALTNLVNSDECIFANPDNAVVTMNYSANDHPILVEKALSWDNAIKVEYSGAGEALRNALKEWGYAK